tara:strand:- start:5192 stop:8089 length:2898 start_codon:yes stop_codon:yes gene_type:complete
LTSDPFSTSPNVDLFYPAVEHRQCLEGLELAIRMRRGLSVIRGGIGVGKTTISRKLIQNFKDESDDFDFYLILDPKFESEIILLKHIIELFGVNDSAESVQECRNIIENHLLKVGVEQGKTLVLIIDEGQNLPGEMLDVFRTLLNFETDEFKLLQLIIFGQPEMGTMIHKYPNFEDRISFDFEIGPISIDDMRGMIDHRIEITGGRIGSWFDERALVKIHKNTQGYPRKVTQLCHQLLLTMISEEKDQINDEMVQRVISGKIDTGGLLQQKKKNYNEIAVNKLLDVLRKDDLGNEGSDPETVMEEDEDDWIGGDDLSNEKTSPPVKSEVLQVEPELPTKEPQEQETVKEPDVAIGSTVQEPILVDKENEDLPGLNDLANDFLPTQGKYPPSIKASLLNKLPVDKTYTGMHLDSGKISSSVIHEDKEVKTLLALDIFSAQNRSLDLIDLPNEFNESCQEAMTMLDTKMSHYEDRYGAASRSVKNRDTLTLTVDHDRLMLQLVDVPKENQKEKKQIIEWSIKKDLQFPLEESSLSFESGKNNTFRVGIGETSSLNSICESLNKLDCDPRSLYPLAQAVYNAFIWSYPENQKKDTIVIHIGEKNSLILGCLRSELKIVKPLFVGIQSLTDAIRDNGMSIEDWSNRKNFQVPETFLRSMGHKAATGEYDDIFRPVFDSWRQELDRTINGIRKEFKISKDTEVLLCGSAGDIQYLDKYIEGSMGLSTRLLNPLRNLAIPHDLDLEEIEFHPTSLTASIGSALHLDRSVNLLPKDKKIEETLRWVNRFGMVATAAALVLFIGLSISTKLSINSIRSDLEPMQEENDELSYVEKRHESLKDNKNSVIQQMQVLSYDIDYFDRILAINRFLSYYTPKEVIINELNFQEGWEIQAYKKIGRDLVKVVRKEDEDLRVVRLAGNVNSNSILLDDHFNNFVNTLEESGLFQNIEIMSQASKVGLGNDNLQFELKCVI